MKSPIIQTNKYTIRPFKKEDALLWREWDIDSEIQAHMPEPKNEPQDIEEQYLYIEECENDTEGYYWSIDSQEETIGTVSLTEINKHHKSAELGIVIGDINYWGKGVATEVINSVVEYAFGNLDIEYISAEVEEDNVGMLKVFDKCGFSHDGLFKDARVKNGERINIIHFSTTK